MARLLSLPRRLAVLLFTFVVSISQFARARPVNAVRRADRSRDLSHTVRPALLLGFSSAKGTDRGFFRPSYAFQATGAFPFVRLFPVSASSPVPVPLLLPAVPRASLTSPGHGLMHAAIGGLSGPAKPAGTPPEICLCSCDSCGGCGSCASCSSCSSCSCTSCGTSCGSNSCIASCGVNSCGTNCSASCGSGFGSCGFTSCSNCLSCASCVSCMSCTSCVCTSCASCSNCGSCASCVG